jgi:hypothetical protein
VVEPSHVGVRFFTNCLSIAWYQTLDELVPTPTSYEDNVNACLGL